MNEFTIDILQEQSAFHYLDPTEFIGCLDFSDGFDSRRYFTLAALEHEKEVFPGVTTVIGQSAGSVGFLLNWYYLNGMRTAVMGEMSGEQDSENMTKEARYFGSFFHGLQPELVKQGCQYDPLHLAPAISDFFQYHRLQSYLVSAWEYRAKKTLAAYLQWVDKEGIEFLAVELPCILRTYTENGIVYPFHVASRIDLVCRNKQGTLLIIDLKTGEGKSYKKYPQYEYQLSFYRLMLLANYPEFQETEIKLYNWSPKKWNVRSKTLYNFEEQAITPISLLSFLCQKFYYERRETFLTKAAIQFSKYPFATHQQNFEVVTYYDLIKAWIRNHLDTHTGGAS